MTTSTLILIIVGIAVLLAIVVVAVMATRRSRMRQLAPDSRQRYAAAWRVIETRFIEDPASAVQEADRLCVEILGERGATLEDERRVPSQLTAAREAARTEGGQGGTEGLRTAMLRYQEIVDDSVGEDLRKQQETHRPEVA